ISSPTASVAITRPEAPSTSRAKWWWRARPGISGGKKPRTDDFVDTDAVLKRLGLSAVNPGAWSGLRGWSTATDGTLVNVRNPANATLLAQVRPASEHDYERVVTSAIAAAAT